MTTMTRGGFASAASSLEFNTGGWRLARPEHRGRHAPCETSCPAGENPRAYLGAAADGDLRAAWEKLVEANPLPAITGRVCHHPCETGCNRGQYDEPIAIHSIERFLGDRAIEAGWDYPVGAPGGDAPAAAIVGAGPAGLSAAYHLLKRGIKPVLFDAQPAAGGLLRSALPPYRLPRTILDREIERVIAAGIDFRPDKRIGRDISIEELRADYRAVFLAPGAERPRRWSADGAEPARMRYGLDLLKSWTSVGDLPVKGKIAIVGGGNTAIDLARVLKFAGATEVHVITFQALPGAAAVPDAMSAVAREIRQAVEAGVIIHDHRGIRRLIMRGEKLEAVEMVHMRAMDDYGRGGRLVAFEGTETILKADEVSPAIGQEVNSAGFESVIGRGPFFHADRFGRLADHAGIFAGGDACGAAGTVSGAIGDGRRAARAIEAYLRGTAPPEQAVIEPIAYRHLNLSYFNHAPRAAAPILSASERSAGNEIESSISQAGVHAEAERCFSCGECMACDNCWTLCPDNSVLKLAGAPPGRDRYVFDYEHCKGCGICAHECPAGFIMMIDEN